jgi:hypothetical protein
VHSVVGKKMNKLDRLLAWAQQELRIAQSATNKQWDVGSQGRSCRETFYDGVCETLEDVIEQIQGLKENP